MSSNEFMVPGGTRVEQMSMKGRIGPWLELPSTAAPTRTRCASIPVAQPRHWTISEIDQPPSFAGCFSERQFPIDE